MTVDALCWNQFLSHVLADINLKELTTLSFEHHFRVTIYCYTDACHNAHAIKYRDGASVF